MFTTLRRVAVLGAATVLASLGSAAPPAAAVEPLLKFEKDQVCAFALDVYGAGVAPSYKQFFDKDGNVRAVLSAGKGQELTFVNRDKGTRLVTPANGAVSWYDLHADGSMTIRLTGHNVVFLFPTDTKGPSATLYTGRAVVTVDASGSGRW